MPTLKRFEELDVWQMAKRQCEALYRLIQNGNLATYGPLQDQMDRASASVMDNIAEGFDRFSRKDFRHFLVIARGSNAGFRSQLYRANDRGAIDDELFHSLKTAPEHLGVKLHHCISYLSKAEFKTKPGAKDLTSGPDSINEYDLDYTVMPAYELPSQFLGV